MGVLSKAAIAAGIVAVGGGAGGYYAHENILPELIQDEMAAAYNATLAKLDNDDAAVKIVKDSTQGFAVQSKGFLQYAVSMPAIELISNNDDFITGSVPAATYNLSIGADQAARYIMNGQAESSWSVTSVQDVTVSLKARESGFYPIDYDFAATCDLSHTLSQDAAGYSLVTAGTDCDFTQRTFENEDTLALEATAGGAFSVTLAQNDGGNDFALRVNSENVEMKFWDTYRDTSELMLTMSMSGLDFATGYYGLQQQFGNVASASDVPDAIFGEFSAQDITGEPDDFDLPPFSVGGHFSVAGMKSNVAEVKAGIGYSVAGDSFNFPQLSEGELPTSADCQFNFDNVPAKALSEATFENIDSLSDLPFVLPFIAMDAGDIISDNDGVSINADCNVKKGDTYDARFSADHTLMGQDIPAGSGRLEIDGYDAALKDLGDFMWMPADQLDAMFNMVAPAQDVDGKKVWEYTIDTQSNVTINGAPLGPIMP